MVHNGLFKILTGRYRHSINFAVNAELAGFWARPTTYFIQCRLVNYFDSSIRVHEERLENHLDFCPLTN